MTNDKYTKPSAPSDGTPDDRTRDESYQDAEQQPAAPTYREELIEDIKELDRQMLKLLGRRARLAEKAFNSKHRRGPTTSQEMDLWRVWEQDTLNHGGDPKRIRSLFDIIQSLEMRKRENIEAGTGFLLTPRRDPLAVSMPGPTSTFTSRLWTILAARCPHPVRLKGVLVNEGLVELVKALNQAGAALSWEEGDLVSRGVPTLSVTDKTVYAGDDPLNLYLLAPLALTVPGHAKFTGGPALKEMDLKPLSKLLPQFGARVSCVVPKSWGVPARIEASGALTDTVEVPAHMPAEAVLGLALAAHGFERGLTITWTGREDLDTLLAEAAALLQIFSAKADVAPGRLRIEPGELSAPSDENSVLPLDVELAAPLLAMPLALRLADREPGSVRLVGRWPADSRTGRECAKLLADAGIVLSVEADAVTATVAPDTAHPAFLIAPETRFAPLTVALAAGWSIASAEDVPVRMATENAGATATAATEFCARLGLALTVTPEGGQTVLHFAPAPGGRDGSAWLAPDAAWGLALSVAALYRPGLGLGAPAVVSASLPGYWSVYNGLPTPEATFFKYAKPKDTDNDAGAAGPARRRIKL